MYNLTEGMKAPGISLQGNRHRQDWGKLFGEDLDPAPSQKQLQLRSCSLPDSRGNSDLAGHATGGCLQSGFGFSTLVAGLALLSLWGRHDSEGL